MMVGMRLRSEAQEEIISRNSHFFTRSVTAHSKIKNSNFELAYSTCTEKGDSYSYGNMPVEVN